MDRRMLENHIDVLFSFVLAYALAWLSYVWLDNIIIAGLVWWIVYLGSTSAAIYVYKKVKSWFKK